MSGIEPTPTQAGVGPVEDPLSDPLIGQLLDGKYRIYSLLGYGGMSVVYDGEHISIGRRVAIKVLHRHCAIHRELVERFEREARAAARIAHPNIVDVLDFGRLGNGIPYIVMERLDGEGLFERLANGGAMPVARAVEIVLEVLAALDAAHRAGVFHRDIKPENVFLVRAPDGSEIVKVVDFGIAKFADVGPEGPRLTGDGLAMGTPAYMAPEQATGSADIDARSDLYSVGVLLYELLSHRLPHEGTLDATLTSLLTKAPTPLRDYVPWVPEGLAAAIHKAISREREDRYQTAAELIKALEDFAKLPPIQVGPIPLFRRNSEPAKTVEAEVLRIPQLPAPPKPGANDDATPGPTALPTPTPIPAAAAKPARPRARVTWLAGAAVLVLAVVGLARMSSNGTDGDAPPRRERARRARVEAPVATQAAPAPTSVPVTVSTNVAGARVSLDGHLLGTTPLDATAAISSAAQLLRIEADGYTPAEYWVRTSQPVRVTVTLERAVDAEPAAEQGRARRPPRKANGQPLLPFSKAY